MKSVTLLKLTAGVFVLSALACGSATISHTTGAAGAGGGAAGGPLAGTSGGGHGGAGGGATGVAGIGGGAAGTTGVAGAGAAGAAGTGGAAGATGVAGGAGGAAGKGLAGAGGGGRGGNGGSATGGTAGAGGGSTCTNTDSDALNCGTCGHSCLGGDCSGGICQPLLLGTIPSTTDYARQTIVTGGKVYVFSQVGRGSAQNAWQLDANTPSTPTEYMTGNGTVSCALNGQLFWVDYNVSNTVTIDSCTFANCAATKAAIVNVASTDTVEIFPGCDQTSNEIIWGTVALATPTTFTIHRASTTGANARQITSFFFPSDGTNWSLTAPELALSNTDRLFYVDTDTSSGKAVLYYISTKTVNAAGVSIATVTAQVDTSGFQSLLTNGSLVIFSAFTPPSTYGSFTAPLPNGVLSGTTPAFTSAEIFGGVIDQTNFYGSLSGSTTVPNDAIVKCPLSNCTTPTIITRGQASANYFADDATAVYWTTSAQTSSVGFSVWKAAK